MNEVYNIDDNISLTKIEDGFIISTGYLRKIKLSYDAMKKISDIYNGIIFSENFVPEDCNLEGVD